MPSIRPRLSMVVFLAQPDPLAMPSPSPLLLTHPAAAQDRPAPDPSSLAGRLFAQQPGGVGDLPVQPAVPPLQQVGYSGNVLAAPSSTPNRVPFDWRQVQLRKEGGSWKLAAGSFVLADFGADEHAARQGLAAVQYYRFTDAVSWAAPRRGLPIFWRQDSPAARYSAWRAGTSSRTVSRSVR